jgi:hypothetical protein
MINSAKRAIAAVLPNADVNDEELQTVFTGVESLLNSRRVLNAKMWWRRLQELVRHVWRPWMKEYLPYLGCRKKCFLPTKNLNVGDVVVVIDPDAARRDWKIGRVEQV